MCARLMESQNGFLSLNVVSRGVCLWLKRKKKLWILKSYCQNLERKPADIFITPCQKPLYNNSLYLAPSAAYKINTSFLAKEKWGGGGGDLRRSFINTQ